jgi:hypothetical protein
MKLVMFDLDGTLTQTCQADETCFVQALREVFGFTDINTDWASYPHSSDSGLLEALFRIRLGRSPLPEEISLETASGTHAQRNLGFRFIGISHEPIAVDRLYAEGARHVFADILTQILLWPSCMNPTVSRNHAMQLTASARHVGCVPRRLSSQLPHCAPPVADLALVR